jgi:hypothetical protein
MLCSICVALSFSACSPPARDAQLLGSLHDALAPEASRSETIDILAALAHSADIVPVIDALGTNNFTTFFLSLQKDSPLLLTDEYECTIPKTDIPIFGKYVGTHATAIAVHDIDCLAHDSSPDGTGCGSFSVDMSWGFTATFLFTTRKQGHKIEVTRLAIKRKDSPDIDDGFIVGGSQGSWVTAIMSRHLNDELGPKN